MSVSTTTSRRSFLKGATAGVAASALGMASVALADEAAGDPNAAPETWDVETDVVVMGYGYAGQASAISAAVEGSKVQVFEKAPEEYAGGNSSVCCGYFNIVTGEGSVEYWKALADGGASDEECQAVAEATELMPEWFSENIINADITENDADRTSKKFNGVEYPNSNKYSMIINFDEAFDGQGGGQRTWNNIDAVIHDRYADSITVNYDSEVTHLIQDPATKEVLGVRVQQGDKEICVKAAKGVIMACGGFEANYEMVKDFVIPGFDQFHIGSPYNTGDGIRMLMEAGVKLRHMAATEYGAICHYDLSQEYQQAVCTYNSGDTTHMVFVNKHGKRFIGENSGMGWPAHDKRYPYPCFNQEKPSLEKANYPFWMVFDETRRTAGTIFGWSNTKANEGWMSVHGPVQWSDDCAPEIEDGYVLKADSIEELGGLMGYEGDDLTAFVDEINAFNENGANGEDPEFGRSFSEDDQKNGVTLGVTDGPFYAIKCGLCYLNTNGGGARNTDYQLVDWNDQPVARLYGAGEFGSIFYHYYSGGGNICECFTSGMKCGQNVSALEPWA